MESDALAYLQNAGAPATPQNMNRIMMAFIDNPALRPSYNAGSYTQDGTFIGADGQGAAVGSYEAGKAAIMRGDAPAAVRERFIRAYGDPGRLTFDMGVPEATTTARAEPIERVETAPQGARSDNATARQPRTETVTPTRKPMPVGALEAPMNIGVDDNGDDVSIVVPMSGDVGGAGGSGGIPMPPPPGPDPVPSGPRPSPPSNAGGAEASNELGAPMVPPIIPPAPKSGATQSNAVTPRQTSAADRSKVNGSPDNIIDAEWSAVDADKSLPKPTTDARALPKPTTDAKAAQKALPAPSAANAPRVTSSVDPSMPTAQIATATRQLEQAIVNGDVRTANETLTMLRRVLPPEAINEYRSAIEALTGPSQIDQMLKGMAGAAARR